MVLHPKETHLVMSVIFQGRVQCGPFILFLNTNAHLVMHFQKDNKIKSTFQKKSRIWRCINWKQQDLEGFFPGH